MKRLIASLTLAIATLFALTAVASATPSSGWKVTLSSPANTTSKTFNVEYTTLSINSSDHITVELFENGTSEGTQTTTKPYGDSGAFSVTVPSTGTYSYYIEATNTGDATPKTTGVVSVEVTNAPGPNINTINVGSTDGTGGGTGGVSTATAGGAAGTGGAAGAGATAGEGEEGDVNAAETGQVGDDPAATEDGDVLGEATDQEKDNTNNIGWILVGIAGLALAGYAAYTYWWVPRHTEK